MNNNQTLRLLYHPARKEIEFHRFQNKNEVEIPNYSKLRSYMNRRGKFVLQDHGNEFFRDIAKAFDALENVDVDVVTTELDYEDFQQMVEYYNSQESTCKIHPRLIATLPSMETTFKEVRAYGEKAIDILAEHKEIICKIGNDNPKVWKSAEQFVQQLNQKMIDIRTKIDGLNDNHVSICFAGVYSAGKSALINAILGYAILPEGKTSETAKMFCISSPKPGETVTLSFKINNTNSTLQWDSSTSSFVFIDGPVENETKTIIQKLLIEEREAKHFQYLQIRTVLSTLNSFENISPSIDIHFPVSLDNERVQFTIYDTPGTDSNFEEHQEILYDALQEQKQSILVFVIHPEKSEGEGNNCLLNYLKMLSEDSRKTSIDLNRSLFVINHADEVKSSEREALRCQEIRNNDDKSISIKLEDKKVLFTSALYGYAAKAVANQIATEDDKWHYEDSAKLTNCKSPYGPCYLQDRCARSECSTKRIIDASESKLADCKRSGIQTEELVVNSGLFALEHEIKLYGERYASAVKAYAIIDNVDKALVALNAEANVLRNDNAKETEDIERSIVELGEAINKAIASAKRKFTNSVKLPLSADICKKLKLDGDCVSKSVMMIINEVNKSLKSWFFGVLGRPQISDEDMKGIRFRLNNEITKFRNVYKNQRKTILTEQRDYFIEQIRNAILKNSDISDDAKNYILAIPEIMVDFSVKDADIDRIHSNHKDKDSWIYHLFKKEIIDDKEQFISDVESAVLTVFQDMADQFCADYAQSLSLIINQVSNQYIENMDSYSTKMQGLIENEKAMMQLGELISVAAKALTGCQQDLNKIIWKEDITDAE